MKINITTPICSTSYGLVGQNLIKAFIKAGVEVSLRLIGHAEPDEACGYDQYVNKCSSQFFTNSPHIIIWHAADLQKYAMLDAFNIGYPIFELNKFDEREIANLSAMDRLIVPSNWGKSILSKYCDKRIDVVPLGVDPDIFQNETPVPEKVIRFLNMGKWEVRKNQLGLAKAFSELFFGMNDVSLTFACHNDFYSTDENKKWENLIKSYVPSHQLSILPFRLNSHRDVAAFLNKHSIGVFPSLAEGWNMELHELLYLNKHCIATNYSGHTEFCTKSNCHLIDIDELEEAWDFKWFFGQGDWVKWTKKQHDQLKEALWITYKAVKCDLTNHETSDIIKKLTWDNSIQTILDSVKEIS